MIKLKDNSYKSINEIKENLKSENKNISDENIEKDINSLEKITHRTIKNIIENEVLIQHEFIHSDIILQNNIFKMVEMS